jgi:hypothetical protein
VFICFHPWFYCFGFEMRDQEQTALVTGASVGIGRDLAIVLAEAGCDLVVTARNGEQLQKLAEELRGKFGIKVEVIVQDLAKPQAADEIFREVEKREITIDLLINNAGFGGYGRFDVQAVEQSLDMLQVNVVALTHLTRLFLPGMVERKRGRVMNVASIAAFLPGPGLAVYYASKAFVVSFSQAVAAELKRTGVTVTALCPGPTETEFQKRAGVENSPIFRGNMMSSMRVARIGYRAMMRGKRVVVTGFKNQLMASAARFAPRGLVTAVAKKLNESRG